VTPKSGDSVAVVARSVEKAEEVVEAVDEAIEAAGGDQMVPDATIEDDDVPESPEEPS
jgi:hypothetical protein